MASDNPIFALLAGVVLLVLAVVVCLAVGVAFALAWAAFAWTLDWLGVAVPLVVVA